MSATTPQPSPAQKAALGAARATAISEESSLPAQPHSPVHRSSLVSSTRGVSMPEQVLAAGDDPLAQASGVSVSRKGFEPHY